MDQWNMRTPAIKAIMRNWTIAKRIFFGFGILTLLCVGICWYAVHQLRSLKTVTANIVTNALPGFQGAAGVRIGLVENRIRCEQLLRVKSKAEIQAIKDDVAKAKEKNSQAIAKCEAALDSKEERAAFDIMTAKRAEYQKSRTDFYAALDTNVVAAEAVLNGAVTPPYNDYCKAADDLMEYNSRVTETQGKQLDKDARACIRILTIIAIAGMVVGIGIGFFIALSVNNVLRSIAENLASGASQVAAAANHVSSSSQVLAQGASEQAASLEESSASLEEMSSMIKRNAENTEKANMFASEARTAVDQGANEMQLMSKAMGEIKSSSDDIAKIIKTIDEIAFQTNILALNAAVEAARAGEAGMGFAVVADEVRNLAQRSAQAAKETTVKIEGAIGKTNQGVQICDRVGQQLQSILTKVRRVDELVSDITQASKEQSQGIEDINTAMGQVDKVIQTSAASSEEGASAAEELHAQAETMHATVGDLNLLVGCRGDNCAKAEEIPAESGLINKRNKLEIPRKHSSAPKIHSLAHRETTPSQAGHAEGNPASDDFVNMAN
jgi:methyl-accepting chemotaxis protein